MRKTLIAAAVAATAFSTVAIAQTTTTTAPTGISSLASTQVQIELSGSLEKRCEIATEAADFTGLDLESLDAQGTGQLAVRCNFSGSPKVSVSSANAGKLVNQETGVDAAIAYLFTVGSDDYNLANAQQVPFTTTVSAADLTPTKKDISVKLTETAIVAGNYTDTVTATVSPN